MDEVLGCLVGLEGRYIVACCTDSTDDARNNKISDLAFRLAPPSTLGGVDGSGTSLDPSLVHLVNRILPLATH